MDVFMGIVMGVFMGIVGALGCALGRALKASSGKDISGVRILDARAAGALT